MSHGTQAAPNAAKAGKRTLPPSLWKGRSPAGISVLDFGTPGMRAGRFVSLRATELVAICFSCASGYTVPPHSDVKPSPGATVLGHGV